MDRINSQGIEAGIEEVMGASTVDSLAHGFLQRKGQPKLKRAARWIWRSAISAISTPD